MPERPQAALMESWHEDDHTLVYGVTIGDELIAWGLGYELAQGLVDTWNALALKRLSNGKIILIVSNPQEPDGKDDWMIDPERLLQAIQHIKDWPIDDE